ncbi:MAG: hypothetical protein ACTHNK_06970 [Thermomicrobiales bacterium]
MSTPRTRINPLSRRPRQHRRVVAVRGAAGTGKSYFAASMADAGLGRLCYFDVERKARLLPGSDGTTFDAIEVRHPDELPEFIDWALDGEGREQGYGCFVLDSWAMYFGRKHRETLLALRERTGDPTAQPTADELAADQMVLQEVLRRLCVDSGACVVIVDQIGAKGREDREENELGRVLPLTTGGLEYFVDVMLEAVLRLEGLDTVRVFRVVKSNSPAFPIGLELRNPRFADLLARLAESPHATLPLATPAPATEPETLADAAPLSLVSPPGPTAEELLAKASDLGFSRAQLITAARHYCGKDDLDRLTPGELTDLDRRLSAHAAQHATAPEVAPAPVAASNGRGRK